jgi:hypothetical protein
MDSSSHTALPGSKQRRLAIHLAPLPELLRDIGLLREIAAISELHLICRPKGHPLLVSSGQRFVRAVHRLPYPDRRWQGLSAWLHGTTWTRVGQELARLSIDEVIWFGAQRRHVHPWLHQWLPQAEVTELAAKGDLAQLRAECTTPALLDVTEAQAARADDWLRPLNGHILVLVPDTRLTPQQAMALFRASHCDQFLILETDRAWCRHFAKQLGGGHRELIIVREPPHLGLLPAVLARIDHLISSDPLYQALATAVDSHCLSSLADGDALLQELEQTESS